MKKIIKIVLIGSLGLVSCKKAELKKPVDVNFAFEMIATEGQDPLKIQSGEINLLNFDVSGDRIEGDDISFMRTFPNNLTTDVNGSGEIKELDYNLPQGEYSEVLLDFSTISNQAHHSLELEGKYIDGPLNVDVRLEVDSEVDFNVIGQDFEGLGTINLDKNLPKKVDVQLNVAHWFSEITALMWTSADLTTENNVDVIVINSTNNQSIYNSVLSNIPEDNKAIFKN